MANGFSTPIGRVAYPHLFEARKVNQADAEDKKRFSVNVVFGPDVDLKPLKAYIIDVVRQKYKCETVEQLKAKLPKNFKWPWRSGSDKVDDEGNQREGFNADDTYFNFWRYERQTPDTWQATAVIGPSRQPLKPADVYGGCLGRVYFRAYTYPNQGQGPGCGLALEAFQKTGDGEAIGAAPVRAADVFDAVAEEAAEVPFDNEFASAFN